MFLKKLILSLLLGVIVFLIFCSTVWALAGQREKCNHRYLTIINPVRGRNLWLDNSISPLKNQYEEIAKYNFSATWLFQYDALVDEEIISFVKQNFNHNQEYGVFLEISPKLATQAKVIYPSLTAWFEPQAIFLSGYPRSDRRKIIDTLFNKFKLIFGYYPNSVGSWWIDSYSLEYLKRKYDVKSALIVANQQKTDNYTVWGHWWGIPYYPSLANVLVPAKTNKNRLELVIFQWAQRDITKAYGLGFKFSNYSLQANDYTERGLTTSYFKQLIGSYLDCQLPIGQVTVGLETGIESVKAFEEYKKQLELLAKMKGLKSVTMSEFSSIFKSVYPFNPEKIVLRDKVSEWVLTPQWRENKYLKDKIEYQDDLAFADYFIADKSKFLERKLPIAKKQQTLNYHYLVFTAFFLGFLIYRKLGLFKYYWYVSLFIIASFLTTILAYSKFGWMVYFGPVAENISQTKFLLVIISFILFIPFLKFLNKKRFKNQLLLLLPTFSYGFDFILSILRYTKIEEVHYLGFILDPLRFIGVGISPSFLTLVNRDFSSLIASCLLKFDFNNLIWESKIISFMVYPLVHLIFGVFIYFVLNKFPKKLSFTAMTIMFILFLFYVYKTVTLDPRVVV